MIILITGDRDWPDDELIFQKLKKKARVIELVIQGGAPGADQDARMAAESLGIQVATFHANWTYYHRAAGPIRNGKQLKYGNPDEVWAFHDHIANSKGTSDMMERAYRAGVSVRLFTHRGEETKKWLKRRKP